MQVNPDAARAYHLRDNNAQYLQTVLLNIIEATESSQDPRSDSIHDSFNIHDNFSAQGSDNQLYQQASLAGMYGQRTGEGEDTDTFTELNNLGKKVVSH